MQLRSFTYHSAADRHRFALGSGVCYTAVVWKNGLPRETLFFNALFFPVDRQYRGLFRPLIAQ